MRLSQKAYLCQPDTSTSLSVTGVEGLQQRIQLHFDFLPTGEAGAQSDKQLYETPSFLFQKGRHFGTDFEETHFL
jgi:hypothetical protein